jgi:hypothetical protein
MGKLQSMVLTSTRHPKTGKRCIRQGLFEIQYAGKDVRIELVSACVRVFINDEKVGRDYERSVPLIQLLYLIRDEVEKR